MGCGVVVVGLGVEAGAVTFDPLRERLHSLEATIRELIETVRELTRRVTDLERRDD